jgi:hypothetical protein
LLEEIRNYLQKPFFVFNVFLRNLQRPKKSTTLKNRKKLVFHAFPKIQKTVSSLHVLKWFLVLISKQQRGDVVSNGDHMGIAVSATEHIAAGRTQVYSHLQESLSFLTD